MRRATLLPLLLVLLASPASADDLRVPTASGLVLDGKPDEAAWGSALALPSGPVAVPPPPGADGPAEVVPEVRVLASGGALWLSVVLAEDPGVATGVALLVAADDAQGTGDAVLLAYVPQELRAPRYVTRGPRGSTRAEYRLRGAADLSKAGLGRLEVTIPFADLGAAGDRAIRVAVQVQTRTPGTVAWIPAGSAFAPPDRWLRLLPPSEGWGSAGTVDAEAIRTEEDRDGSRLAAWHRWLEATRVPLTLAPRDQIVAQARKDLVAPLDDVLASRPDLALARVLKADVLRKVGLAAEADVEARAALEAVPGLREAAFSLHVEGLSASLAERPAGEPTDYAAALARVDAASAAAAHPMARDGAALGRALLLQARGDFAEAIAVLEPLARRYPAHPPVVETLARAKASLDAWPVEEQYRRQDAGRALPHAKVTTSRGSIVLELFEDDAPNTVKSFVWLARKGFYDGTTFHRVVPFLAAQGGDPFSREADEARRALVGSGGPCYAIPTESGVGPSRRHRRPYRGSVAMARAGARDTEGSQFFLATGTAAHLDGDVAVFGRILEGQEVADALAVGDRIERVEVENPRPGTEYRPTTTGGQPAPDPRPCGPGGR